MLCERSIVDMLVLFLVHCCLACSVTTGLRHRTMPQLFSVRVMCMAACYCACTLCAGMLCGWSAVLHALMCVDNCHAPCLILARI
jgi:hypothetical protein